jgi:hypothetical protein
MQVAISLRFEERTRLGCWRRRPADASETLGETPRVACGTQALPGESLARLFTTKPKPASGYRTHGK